MLYAKKKKKKKKKVFWYCPVWQRWTLAPVSLGPGPLPPHPNTQSALIGLLAHAWAWDRAAVLNEILRAN